MRDENAPREIAKRVRLAIRVSGLTQLEVARRLGWPQQRLNRRLTEADYAAPFEAAELAQVAGVLGVPPSQFLLDPAEPTAEPAGDAR
jgi:transcriptional regulator with XRE-family HTH domain